MESANQQPIQLYQVTHQNDKKCIISITTEAQKRTQKMLNEGHKEKLSKGLNLYFVPPIIITVKRRIN